MLITIAFYVFAAILIGSAAMVVSARNPVHAVLFLIAGAEFLAMILVIVYVGAVAVLFLFVVMMLDVNFDQLREGFQRYAPAGAAIGIVLFAELVAVLGGWQLAPNAAQLRHAATPEGISNTAALGRLIYTDYVFLFQACGIVLLVAMIGAIVLTLRDRPTSKKQDIAVQHARTPADTLSLLTPALGAGVDGAILRPKPPAPGRGHEHEPALTDAHGVGAHLTDAHGEQG
jgi:NADH-quinone oxidoreductase subunit J